jgi:hypothetical protein
VASTSGSPLSPSSTRGQVQPSGRDVALRSSFIVANSADGIPLLLADITERDATIATLRAELDGLVEAVEIAIGYIDQRRSEAMPIWYQDFDALRAALAAVKEATDVD